MIEQPIELSSRSCNDGTVSGKGGFLSGIFVLQFWVNLSADDEDLQAHAQFAGEARINAERGGLGHGAWRVRQAGVGSPEQRNLVGAELPVVGYNGA